MSEQSQSLEKELSVAVEAIRVAAQVCRSVQLTIGEGVLEKDDKSPVTIADYASQAVICRALQAAFPDDPIIGEEDAADLKNSENAVFMGRIKNELAEVGIDAGDNQICEWIDRGASKEYSPRFWTLDPIDGTKGFLRGGQYAIALALIVDGKVELGLLGCPNLALDGSTNTPSEAGTVFYAVRGQGSRAFCLSDTLESAQEVKVSDSDDPAKSCLCESVEKGHSSHSLSSRLADRLGITSEPFRLDSQAKYAVVSRGNAEIYLRLPSKPGYMEKIWDHAAGVLVVEEAGGKVTDVFGKDLDFSQGYRLSKNAGIVATNHKWHDSVLNTLAILHSEMESGAGGASS